MSKDYKDLKVNAYYKVKKYHKQIFNTTEPVSFFELVFAIEAPWAFTEMNIWEYVIRLSFEDIPAFFVGHENIEKLKLSREECENYPYYELIFSMIRNIPICPLIIEELPDGTLIDIEGRHRLRLMALWYKLEGRFPEIPCVIVKKVEERKEKRIPLRYEAWQDYVSSTSIHALTRETKRIYAKFLRAE